jgi:transcriptional regulator with XRE-family HTH domain
MPIICQGMKSNNTDLKILGYVLRSFREAMGISQEKLAERASLHRTYIGSVERGERNVSFRNLNMILEALSVNWIEFGSAIHKAFLNERGRSKPGSGLEEA